VVESGAASQDIAQYDTQNLHLVGHNSAEYISTSGRKNTVNPSDLQAALFAPEEYMALFSCTAGELSFTKESLRYLGVLTSGVDRTSSAA